MALHTTYSVLTVTSYYTVTRLFGLFMIPMDLLGFGAYLPLTLSRDNSTRSR
jgi:hypothetical protein